MLDKMLSWIADYINSFATKVERNTNNTTDTWVPVWNGTTLQHRVIPAQIGTRKGVTIELANTTVITNTATSCELVQINATEHIGFFTIRLNTTQTRTNLACCRFKLNGTVLKPIGTRSFGAKMNGATMLNSWWNGDWFVAPGNWNANNPCEIWGACIFTTQ